MKIKKAFWIVGLLMLFSVNIVNAKIEMSELDPDNKIYLPTRNYTDEFKITIYDATEYDLYGQSIILNETISEEIDKLITQINQDGEKYQNELAGLKNELETMKENCNSLKSAYDVLVSSKSQDDPETQAAQTKYQEAYSTYQAKSTEATDKANEYKKNIEELQKKEYDLIADFDDAKWQKLDNDTITIDLSYFSDKKKVALWVKLVEKDQEPIYDYTVYELEGTKVDVESITLDKTELTLNVGQEYVLTAKIEPNDATTKDVIWKSDNMDVAIVSNGKVTGVKAGTANITVTTIDGGKVATCKVTIKNTESTVTEENNDEQPPAEDKKDYADEKISEKENPKTGFYGILSFIIVGIGLIIFYVVKYKNKNNLYRL